MDNEPIEFKKVTIDYIKDDLKQQLTDMIVTVDKMDDITILDENLHSFLVQMVQTITKVLVVNAALVGGEDFIKTSFDCMSNDAIKLLGQIKGKSVEDLKSDWRKADA